MDLCVSLWIDKKYNFYRLCGLPMGTPDALAEKAFQGIILSSDFVEMYYRSIAKNIQNTGPVYTIIGESEDMADFPWTNPKYTDLPPAPEELIVVDPVDLINEKRLDIVIRCMACKDIMNKGLNDGTDWLDAYTKLILSMNDGEEFIRPFITNSYFSDYTEKKGTERFVDALKSLIDSIQENGFSPKHFIPLSETRGIINGAHRTAVALALGINVYAKIYVGFGEPFLSFEKTDLKQRGYTDAEIEAIEKAYIQIKSKKK
jgi:hypothetical protein